MEYLPSTWRSALPVVALAGALAACSAGSAGGAAPSSPANSGSAGSGATFGNGANSAAPAASGEIAQITGRTLQVQSETDQTAVTYSARTRFTTEKATTLASVEVGKCVVAFAANTSSGSSHTNITATSVRISDRTSGGCAQHPAGPGGSNGAPPSSFPSGAVPSGTLPSGTSQSGAVRQDALPSGAPRGGKFTPGAVVAGTVTAVHGSTISVRTSTPSGTSSTGTVRVTAATTFSTTVATTHAALHVGLCAVVNGSTNSSGAVSASRIALSPKTNGSCTALVRRGPNG